jgi:hypothetical protein
VRGASAACPTSPKNAALILGHHCHALKKRPEFILGKGAFVPVYSRFITFLKSNLFPERQCLRMLTTTASREACRRAQARLEPGISPGAQHPFRQPQSLEPLGGLTFRRVWSPQKAGAFFGRKKLMRMTHQFLQ